VTDNEFLCVLDASALLALLHSEPGAEIVEEAVEEAAISAVNWAEVYQRWLARGVDVTDLRADLEALGMQIVPFIVEDAEQAAELWSLTRQHGLSLGDRACLGLARRLGLPALTADRAWLDISSGVDVQAIRGTPSAVPERQPGAGHKRMARIV
jgi:ribonuclease VapC